MQIFVTLKATREDSSLHTLADSLETEITHAGHTPFIATRELQKRGLAPGFMTFIRQHIEQSDLLLLLYHPDLRGGLIEQGIAYAKGLPIWLCCETGTKISTTARDCATKIIAYSTHSELIYRLHEELAVIKENL